MTFFKINIAYVLPTNYSSELTQYTNMKVVYVKQLTLHIFPYLAVTNWDYCNDLIYLIEFDRAPR